MIFDFISVIIAKEPISAGAAAFTEKIGEKYADLFIEKVFDGTKKHYENAAKIVSSQNLIKELNEAQINSVMMSAYKVFNKQTNLSRKLSDYIDVVRKAVDDSSVEACLKDDYTDILCKHIYECIMQEDDEKDGDKLKNRFKASQEAYKAVIREQIKELIQEEEDSSYATLDEDKVYCGHTFAFESEKMISDACKRELCEFFNPENSIYDISFNSLGNLISISARDGEEGETGKDSRSTCDGVIACLNKHGVATDAIIYSKGTDHYLLD